MTKRLAVSFILSLVPHLAEAERLFDLHVEPLVNYSVGETEYIMDIAGYVDNDGEVEYQRLTSKLEFPLDAFSVGGAMRLESARRPGLWGGEFSFAVSMTEPGGTMFDSDWQGVAGSVPYTMFSYTESSAEMNSWYVQGEAYWRVIDRRHWSFAFVAGYRYYNIDQDVIGYDGWFRQFNETTDEFSPPVSVSGDGLAATYKLTLHMPQIGAKIASRLDPRIALEFKAAYMPVFFDDVDDHVLRNKLSTADGDGNGFISRLRMQYDVHATTRPGPRVYIAGEMEFFYLNAFGRQVQYWYGDDGATPGQDDTGQRISGIPHEINTTRFFAGLRLGVRL